jgi:hypothetical protein
VSAAVPYLVDPIGAGIHDLTGFRYTPGGAVADAITPPRRPLPPPVSAQAGPTPPNIRVPRISAPGPGVPPATRTIPPNDKAGATPGVDATRGLILRRGGPGKTLLG